MSFIAENIASLKLQIPSSVKLVAVSKTKPVIDILKLIMPDRIFWRKQGEGTPEQKRSSSRRY